METIECLINLKQNWRAGRCAMRVLRREGKDHLCEFSASTYAQLKFERLVP